MEKKERKKERRNIYMRMKGKNMKKKKEKDEVALKK
jgi:hypothetical protein